MNKRVLWSAVIVAAVLCAGGLWWWSERTQQSMENIREDVVIAPGPETFPDVPAGTTVVVAVGSFDHPEPNNRRPDFPDALAKYLIGVEQKGTKFVERNLGAANAPVVEAGWVVNGTYASLPGSSLRVDLKLERVKGGEKSAAVQGSLDGDLKEKIAQAIAESVRTSKEIKRSPARTEAELHRRQGIALSGFSGLGISLPVNAFNSRWEDKTQVARDQLRAQQAIRSLESSLALDPKNDETKLYLGACLELPFLKRIQESRKLYWEVIKGGKKDATNKRARMRLALSWEKEDPKQALDLLRTFEEEAPTPEEASSFRSFANSITVPTKQASDDYYANKKNAAIVGLEELAEKLKDPRQTSVIMIPQVHYVFRSDEPGKEKEDAARAWGFIQELKPKFPGLFPYMVFEAIRSGSEAHPDLVEEGKRLIGELRKNPEQILRPKYFHGSFLNSLALSMFEKSEELAMETILLKEESRAKGIGEEMSEELRMAKGYGLMSQEKWTEALAIFESMGNRVIQMSRPGPWNCRGGCPYSVAAAAEQCRAKLGVASPNAGFHRTLSETLVGSRGKIAMAAEGSEVWVATDDSLLTFDDKGELKKKNAFKPPGRLTTMAISPERIYFGTDGEGLVAVDRKVFQAKSYRMADGLLFDNITDLRLVGEKLWIGYGHGVDNQGRSGPRDIFGGVGYLDIATDKAVGFPSSEPRAGQGYRYPNSEQMRNPDPVLFASYNVSPGDQMPPSRPVFSISGARDGSVMMAVPGRGIRRYEPASGNWNTLKVNPNIVTCVEASGDYLCVGQTEQYSQHKGKSLWIRRHGETNFKFVSVKEGLPHEDVYSLLLDKDTLWVGGFGYVAAFNLSEMKFTKVLSVQNRAIVKLARTGDRLWIAGDNCVYTTPL